MGRKKLFKTSLLIYTMLILLIAIIFLTYIYFTLKEYEANQTNNFIKKYNKCYWWSNIKRLSKKI